MTNYTKNPWYKSNSCCLTTILILHLFKYSICRLTSCVNIINYLLEHTFHNLLNNDATTAYSWAMGFLARIVVFSERYINFGWVPLSHCKLTFVIFYLLCNNCNIWALNLFKRDSDRSNCIYRLSFDMANKSTIFKVKFLISFFFHESLCALDSFIYNFLWWN